MSFLKKLIPVFIFTAIFGLVISQIQPPQSLPSSSPTQLLLFFLPLLLFLTFLLNLYYKFTLKSLLISLSIVALFFLKGFDLFNIFSVTAILAFIVLTLKFLKRPKKFDYQPKIPKLSQLSKQR